MCYQVGLNSMGDVAKTIDQYIKNEKSNNIDLSFILINIDELMKTYEKTISCINNQYNMNLLMN